ncbi:hypothetical protein, partial [Streptomyces sp. NPDC057582]|uniref:hypothetical protein n=1 Tax=Streptomyces sp. NPDC057582 TaxID=3346174 RepID=UPI0036B496CA
CPPQREPLSPPKPKHVEPAHTLEHSLNLTKPPDGTTVRLGVFLSNQKTRRDRLTDHQLTQLANLGYHWAV